MSIAWSPELNTGIDVIDQQHMRIVDFINDHDTVFVVEQNESAQLRMLLINEAEVDPKRLIRVLHYDGTPITARFIIDAIARHAHQTAAEAPPEAA